jgi:polysaccharide transporter, PST family
MNGNMVEDLKDISSPDSCTTEVETRVPLSPKRSLFESISSLMALQGLNYVIPLVTLPYLVRVLGIGPFGLISVAQAFATYFVIFTDYGFNLSATRRIAQHHDDMAAVSEIFSAVITIKIIFMFFGVGAMVLVLSTVPHFRPDAHVYAVNYLAVVGSVLLPTWLFQGLQDMRTIAILNGITKLASACLLFVFVHSSRDYFVAAALPPIGVLVSGVAGLWICLQRLNLHYRFPTYRVLREQLADGFHLFVSTASITLYTNTNVLLVGLLAGNVQAGYFSTGERVVRAAQGLLGPVFQGIFPHVNAMARESKERAVAFLRRSLFWIVVASLSPSLALLIFAHPIVVLAFGNKALGSVPVLRWIALLPFVIALSNVFGIQTMVTFGMEKQFSRILIAAGAVNLVLCVLLVLRWGASGAAASVLAVEVGVTLATAVFVWRFGIFHRNLQQKVLV